MKENQPIQAKLGNIAQSRIELHLFPIQLDAISFKGLVQMCFLPGLPLLLRNVWIRALGRPSARLVLDRHHLANVGPEELIVPIVVISWPLVCAMQVYHLVPCFKCSKQLGVWDCGGKC